MYSRAEFADKGYSVSQFLMFKNKASLRDLVVLFQTPHPKCPHFKIKF